MAKSRKRTKALDAGPPPLDAMRSNIAWCLERVREAEKEYAVASRIGGVPRQDLAQVVAHYRKMLQSWAVDAAPYEHAKLAPVDSTNLRYSTFETS